MKDIEKNMAKNVALVEYYYHVQVDAEYPLLKFNNQLEQLGGMFENDAKRFGLIK